MRVDVEAGNERLAKQIRNSEQARVPLMGVVGEREIESRTLAIRSRKGKTRAQAVKQYVLFGWSAVHLCAH